MKTIWIARHGNTFPAGQIPVWIGGREDPDLTPEGRIQAESLGRALERAFEAEGWPTEIRVSPLQRTQQTLLIASSVWKSKCPPIVADIRLREIDYGLWAGRTSADIQHQWGIDTLEHWQNQAAFPTTGQWGESPEFLTEQIRSLLREGSESELWLTSGGKARLLLKTLGLITPSEPGKLSTAAWGNLQKINEKWVLKTWNRKN